MFLNLIIHDCEIFERLQNLDMDQLILALIFRACLHRGGRPQVGEVTCGGSPHL